MFSGDFENPPGTSDSHVSAGRSDVRGLRLARSLVQLSELRLRVHEPEEMLHRVGLICRGAFLPPVAVSVTMGDPAAPTLSVSTAKLAQDGDGAQMVAGEGPCQSAWEGNVTIATANMYDDERWPRLSPKEASRPVLSTVAAPLCIGGDVVGALNVYSEHGAFEEHSVEGVELFVKTIATVLRDADIRSGLKSKAEQLEGALTSRATIDQAKGMVMASRGCGPEEAFQVLAELSSKTNVKLRDIAARMVEEASQGTRVLPDQRRDGGRDAALGWQG